MRTVQSEKHSNNSVFSENFQQILLISANNIMVTLEFAERFLTAMPQKSVRLILTASPETIKIYRLDTFFHVVRIFTIKIPFSFNTKGNTSFLFFKSAYF